MPGNSPLPSATLPATDAHSSRAGDATSSQNPLTQVVVHLEPNMRLGVTWMIVHRRSVAAGVEFTPHHAAVTPGGRASTTATFTVK